jgi:glycosyltransferase involved in cell wall biosynthesis
MTNESEKINENNNVDIEILKKTIQEKDEIIHHQNDELREKISINRILESEMLILKKDFKLVESDYKEILNSSSWKVTLPLRKLSSLINKNFHFLSRSLQILKIWGFKELIKRIAKKIIKSFGKKSNFNDNNYENWIELNEMYDFRERQRKCLHFKYKPFISIVMPVYNVKKEYLVECIDSVLQQSYSNWELCIADDCSTAEHIKPLLMEYMEKDKRIKVCFRKENGHISEATNSAINMAKGDYIALLDNDDIILPFALFEIVKHLNENPQIDIIYSDEDKLLDGKRINPFFKPAWSPDLMRCQNYLCHLTAIRRCLVDQIGGFRSEFNGAQDFDLFLRLSEIAGKILHIPKVLYNWRMIESSTAANPGSKNYAQEAGLNAVDQHLKRLYGDGAYAKESEYLFVYDARYPLPPNLLVSIIIPTKDGLQFLKPCIESIINKTKGIDYEIIIIDNNSENLETFEWLKFISDKYSNIKVIKAEYHFNWSKLNNQGIGVSNGDVFVFLNNDTEILTEDWLVRLSENAWRDDVGLVGPLLLFDDHTIQHAGVVVGIGGWADHVFKGLPTEHKAMPFISPMVTRNVLAVTGACMAVSRKTLDKIGIFNEKYIICGSDIDLCLHAYESKLFNVYTPFVKMIHHESKTRDSFIPEEDFLMSYRVYHPYLSGGDPFFSPNLDLKSVIPKIKNY